MSTTNTQTRLDAKGLQTSSWTDTFKPILNNYDNTKHETLQRTPNQATQK